MKLKRTKTISVSLAFFALALVGYAFQATFIQDGDAIDYAPAANTNVEAGEVVIIGDLVGVAKYDIPSNTVGAVSLRGVYELAKPVEAISAGVKVYWDASAGNATTNAESNNLFGLAVADAALSNLTVRVLLDNTVN